MVSAHYRGEKAEAQEGEAACVQNHRWPGWDAHLSSLGQEPGHHHGDYLPVVISPTPRTEKIKGLSKS